MSALARTAAWLNADVATTRRQAAAQNAWRAWRRFGSNPLGLVGLAVVVLLVATALFAPWLATQPPNDQNLAARLMAPASRCRSWPSSASSWGPSASPSAAWRAMPAAGPTRS